MILQSTALVITDNASGYLEQLCRLWRDSLAVEYTEDDGIVIFPRDARNAGWPGHATLRLQAGADNLQCRLTASARDQLEALKRVVAHHLDGFARREGALRFEWLDEPR